MVLPVDFSPGQLLVVLSVVFLRWWRLRGGTDAETTRRDVAGVGMRDFAVETGEGLVASRGMQVKRCCGGEDGGDVAA